MHRWNWGILWLSAMLFAFGPSGQAQNPSSYQLAVGAAGTDSFVFGTELWAATQINLLPTHNLAIETVAVHSDQERLISLRDGFFDFALVRDKANLYVAGNLRAVMAFWPNGVDKVGAPATQLLVHPETPYGVVYHVTKMIFEHAANLRSAHATIGIGTPRSAIVGLELPMHPGALRYYEERGLGIGRRTSSTQNEPTSVQVNASEVAVDHAFDEAKPLEAACRQAAAHKQLHHSDSHNPIDACAPELVDAADADLGWGAPTGKGGPRVLPGGGEELDWRTDPGRSVRQNQIQGIQPTM